MAKQKTKLIKSEEIAEGTMAFHFEKPAGFNFIAGQTLDLTLIDPPETDTEGNTRTFSIASAPHEDHLMIATRIRDTAFKRVLKNMSPGTEVEFDGPIGSFTLHNNKEKPAVFLAGGIGVTPVRAISLDAAHRTLSHRIFVFYSNRRPEDTAFLGELSEIAKTLPNFKLIATMTDMQKSNEKWGGEQGYISKEMIVKYLPDMSSAIFYLDGPMTMVNAMRTLLSDVGIDSDNIKTEEFPGY